MGAAREIAADQGDALAPRQAQQAAIEGIDPLAIGLAGESQRDEAETGFAAHGRNGAGRRTGARTSRPGSKIVTEARHMAAGGGPRRLQGELHMFPRLCVWVLLASPTLTFAASKEIQELQRDLAQLQQQVRDLQRSQDEKFAALQVLVQQAVDHASKANTAVAVVQSGLQQNIRDLESKIVPPVAGLASRMDQVSNDMRTVQQAVSDVTGLMSKLQAQLTDLGNAVKVMQAPSPAPPAQTTSGGASAAPETPAIPATDLYSNARRDMSGGKLDLALQEFSDYLKWYGNTDLAPNAQYYMAYIHSSQGDYDNAVQEFDMVLEKYPDNNKTPDALYNKGLALAKMGRRTDGAQEFHELIKRFPSNDLSKRACDQLKGMGLSCGPRAATPAKGAGKRTKK